MSDSLSSSTSNNLHTCRKMLPPPRDHAISEVSSRTLSDNLAEKSRNVLMLERLPRPVAALDMDSFERCGGVMPPGVEVGWYGYRWTLEKVRKRGVYNAAAHLLSA